MSALPPGQSLDHLLARSSQLDEALALLKRAAAVITTWEIESGRETQLLPEIGAFLGKVVP
jgi:hypothetical protein